MNRPPEDRTERLSQLQALVDDESRNFPQLDRDAFDTALAGLAEEEQRRSRWRRYGWILIVAIVIVAAVLVFAGLR